MSSESPQKNSMEEKHPPHQGTLGEHFHGRQLSVNDELVQGDQRALHRDLQGRHMQFIAM